MELRTEETEKTRVEDLLPGEAFRYKSTTYSTYMVLSPVRVKGLNPGWIPCANLISGTIRRLPPFVEVEVVNARVDLS